jgi:hypothetical protein
MRKELTRNWNRNIVGRRERLDTLSIDLHKTEMMLEEERSY